MSVPVVIIPEPWISSCAPERCACAQPLGRDLTERKGDATMARQAKGTTEICPCLRGDLKKLAKHMRDLGWTFEQGKHCKVFAPDGVSHTSLSCTPSDVTSYRNSRAVFRRWCRDNVIAPPV